MPETQILFLKFTNNPDKLTRSMEECGMVYMHAQLFNPAMKSVGPVRKALQQISRLLL